MFQNIKSKLGLTSNNWLIIAIICPAKQSKILKCTKANEGKNHRVVMIQPVETKNSLKQNCIG